MRKPASTRISATGRPESGKLPDSRELRNTWILNVYALITCLKSWVQTSLTSGSMWVRQDVRMTPPPNMVRQENRVTMVGVWIELIKLVSLVFFLTPAGFLSDAANPSGHPAVAERLPIVKCAKIQSYKLQNGTVKKNVVQLER